MRRSVKKRCSSVAKLGVDFIMHPPSGTGDDGQLRGCAGSRAGGLGTKLFTGPAAPGPSRPCPGTERAGRLSHLPEADAPTRTKPRAFRPVTAHLRPFTA